jgi:dTDP-4-dehydrorhamnose 3,5-epimerase
MIVTQTPIAGLFFIDPEPITDERGFFASLWDNEVLAKTGLTTPFTRSNVAYNPKKGTLRGLHAQVSPFAEEKLVTCTKGAIFDVAVDCRPGSPTYRRWFGMALSADNRRMLLLPKGCAHGYQTLQDDTDVLYQVTSKYSPEHEVGLRWNDPIIGIVWPHETHRLISSKDTSWPLLTNEAPLQGVGV